jgi:imidazole glycerol-phosphate synthase subunit HisF
VLAKRIIACLDIRAGRVVKGRCFVDLRDAGDPLECAMTYCREGIDELVVLDVSATLEDRLASCTTVENVARAVNVPVTVGGGVRSIDDFSRLLDSGADKVAVNSAALDRPELIAEAAERFGTQCVVLSVDTRRRNARLELATHSASVSHNVDPIDWASRGQALGAGELLLTSIDRDGTRTGFDVASVSNASKRLTIPVIASGGAVDAGSFADVLAAGADAALGASVFHFGDVAIGAIKRTCAARGLEIRP